MTGKAAVAADWTQDAPGVRHKITLDDLPPPFQTKSVTNDARVVARPEGAQLQVPAGLQDRAVRRLAFETRVTFSPRQTETSSSRKVAADIIKVLRDTDGDGKPNVTEVFAEEGLNDPFGIAFYPPGPEPQYLYVANTNGVVRFPYRNGDTKARGPARKTGRGTFRRRAPSRRRTLDARHRVLA